ncbi:MAG: hypothetical protein QOE62_2599 [Actinomycetota bacterium]|nr:hypothetical protein [Actinomycetota bacterium]
MPPRRSKDLVHLGMPPRAFGSSIGSSRVAPEPELEENNSSELHCSASAGEPSGGRQECKDHYGDGDDRDAPGSLLRVATACDRHDEEGVDGGDCKQCSDRDPLQERERDPGSPSFYTTAAEFGAGHGDSLRRRRREHVPEAGDNEPQSDRRTTVDVGADKPAEQKAQREVAHCFGERARADPNRLGIPKGAEGILETAGRGDNHVQRACADQEADGEADPARSNCAEMTALCPRPHLVAVRHRETVWPTNATLTGRRVRFADDVVDDAKRRVPCTTGRCRRSCARARADGALALLGA